MFRPQYDQEDLPRFVDYLDNLLAEDEQVVRLEIINSSNANLISIEPVGACDNFPAGSRFEVIALVRKNKPDLIIETVKTHVTVYANDIAAVFSNGIATLAIQDWTR